MRVKVIGGGPAGLYFSLLRKKRRPETEIEVFERNGPDDTFGWGVVFSKETLDRIREADGETYAEIREHFAYWDDIETFVGGEMVRSSGHGFCGLSRRRLLRILQQRCEHLGVRVHFHREISLEEAERDADLVLAADGVNSRVREELAAHFEPNLDWRACKFSWLGTDRPLEAFTFHFKETPHGLFQVHAYPFEDGLATWIVECREEVWRRAGLDEASEEETVERMQALFADELAGHRLFANRSIWRTFPTVRCKRWVTDKVVLLGDAAHTAHFSIGSGTKLAMESAIALVEAFEAHEEAGVAASLEAYEKDRWVDVAKTQRAAQTSLEWFENSARYLDQDPVTFSFNLMTRSKRITYDNLALRDPELVRRTRDRFASNEGLALAEGETAPDPIFVPFRLRDLELRNRIVVSPMCQYSAREGVASDWHLVHLGSRAIGGAGLVLTEMTNVTPQGRITKGCAGLWNEAQREAWARVVRFVKEHTRAAIGIQLAHAGRKGSCHHPWDGRDRPLRADEGAWTTLGPSAHPFEADWPAPKEMDESDLAATREAFVTATRLALEADFDLIELHAAHGYLLSSFLSPLSNLRRDAYGGDLAGRMRFPLEVFEAVRAAWPRERPLAVRISATDWLPDGFQPEEAVSFARALKERGCDVIDVSTAGNVPESRPVYGRMYQVPFAERVRYEAEIPVMAVGAILDDDHANTILAAGRADLCCLARVHLRDPYLTLRAGLERGFVDEAWPPQYLAGRDLPAK